MPSDLHNYSTLRDYFKVLFKHKPVILTTIIVIVITVYVNLSFVTPSFIASVKMMKEGEKSDAAEYYKEFRMSSRALSDVELVTSNPVVEKTVKALRLYDRALDYEKKFASPLKSYVISDRVNNLKNQIETISPEQRRQMLYMNAVKQLKSNINVEQVKDTNMFTISVSDFDPSSAILIANVLSRAYMIYDLERQLAENLLKYGEKHSITYQIKDKISELEQYLDGRPLTDIEAIGPASVKIIEQAKEAVPVQVYNKRMLLALTVVLSVVMGFIFAFGIEYIDQTIKSPRDIETFLGIPFLGSLPRIKGKKKLLVSKTNFHSFNQYQFYQNLTDQLHLLIKDGKLKSILITDVESSDETAMVIANIGLCLANNTNHNSNGDKQNKVLLIDANLRSPFMFSVFNVSNSPGLTDSIEGKVSVNEIIKNISSNLYLITAGDTELNPSTILSSAKLSEIIQTLKDHFELILLSGADLKNYTDTVMFSSNIDAYILIVNDGKVKRQVLKYAISPLEQKKANIIGVILNNRRMAIPKVIYDHI